MQIDVYKIDGTLTGEKVDLSDSVFSIEKPNDHAIYLSVKQFLANQRQGTSKSKERSEVSGGGKKPWKQKGKGGARAGTTRSPLWVGGGTIFGPKPRDHRQDLNKKVKTLAKASALTYKVQDKQLMVVEDFELPEYKTQSFTEILDNLKVNGKKILFLTNGKNDKIYRSGRNVAKVKVMESEKAAPYDILNNQVVIYQKSAILALNEKMSGAGKRSAE
ncbi:MAG: 50S ribosomal protein L4 [Ignavibacteriaceae bacterium]|nr:50S ribosomal protein L4 [Ignavibacteriaceae bacterium]